MGWEMLFWLLVSHAVVDFPLQGDFLARGKNHRAPLPGVPWIVCLVAHAHICGGAVALVTGSWQLGVAEAVVHAITDFAKNEGWLGIGETGFVADQLIHVACKLVWLWVALA